MTAKVPRILMVAGLLIYSLLFLKRHSALGLGSSVAIVNTVGIHACTAFIAGSVFLSLYGFLTARTDQKLFLILCIGGSFILVAMCLGYYFEYAIINRTIDKLEASKPNILPVLVQKARIDESAENREKYARMAFEVYGVQLSYKEEDGNWTYYKPSAEGESQIRQIDNLQAVTKNLRKVSWGLLNGCVAIVYTTFIAFLVGMIWLTYKKLPQDGRSPFAR